MFIFLSCLICLIFNVWNPRCLEALKSQHWVNPALCARSWLFFIIFRTFCSRFSQCFEYRGRIFIIVKGGSAWLRLGLSPFFPEAHRHLSRNSIKSKCPNTFFIKNWLQHAAFIMSICLQTIFIVLEVYEKVMQVFEMRWCIGLVAWSPSQRLKETFQISKHLTFFQSARSQSWLRIASSFL